MGIGVVDAGLPERRFPHPRLALEDKRRCAGSGRSQEPMDRRQLGCSPDDVVGDGGSLRGAPILITAHGSRQQTRIMITPRCLLRGSH